MKFAMEGGAEITQNPYEIRMVNKGSLKIIRMEDTEYRYNVEVLKAVARVVDKFGFASEEKTKAVADLEAMVTAQTGFPWSVPRVNPPPVDFIKPDPEDLEREWQQALERQRSLFGPPPPREAIPVEEGVVKEAFVQFIKGDPPAILYLSTDQKKNMINLSQKELMKKSANFLKQLYEVAVMSHEPDQAFKDSCLKYLFQMASEKMKLQLQYES